MTQEDLIKYAKDYAKNISSQSLKNLEETQIPNSKSERWRYYPVKALNFSAPNSFDLNAVRESLQKISIPGFEQLVFVNTQWVKDLSSPLAISFSKPWEVSENARTYESFLEPLCEAFQEQTMYLEIDTPCRLQVVHIATNSSAHFQKIHVNVKASGKVWWHETCVTEDSNSQINISCEFQLREASHLEYSSESQGVKAQQYTDNQFFLDPRARLRGFHLDIDSQLVRRRCLVELKGEEAEADLLGFYLMDGEEKLNHIIDVKHLVPNAKSSQLYKGILSGQSRVAFDAKVYVAKGAMGTDSSQLNKSVLLSDFAELDTKPQLEIYADDVSCSHGATLGAFQREELFYFESRAIPRKKAFQMLAKGFAEDVFLRLEDENLHGHVSRAFDKKFQSMGVDPNDL